MKHLFVSMLVKQNFFVSVCVHTQMFNDVERPGGTSISGGRGGLDLVSSLEAKFGARFSQVHQIRGKI